MYNPTQRLMRSRTDKVIAGVAGGIGQYLAIDPVIVRLAFVALCFTGVGVLLYPVLWLIMPVEGGQRATPDQVFDEMRQQAARRRRDPDQQCGRRQHACRCPSASQPATRVHSAWRRRVHSAQHDPWLR